MKIQVTCSCGSVFAAPDQLAGQMVRCPSCRKTLTVPEVGDTSPQLAPGPEPDLGDLTSLENDALESTGSRDATAGRSSIRLRSRGSGETSGGSTMGDGTSSDQAISQEVDDRMTRLYEVYAGKEMRIKTGGGSKLKLLIGLGIAVLTIGIGIVIAVQVLKTEYGVGDGEVAEDNNSKPVVVEARKQAVDNNMTWAAASASEVSDVAMDGVHIDVERSDDSRYTFNVEFKPASSARDSRLSMATSVVLYRALDEQGPFKQIDRAKVDGFNRATGSLTFEVFDDVPEVVGANLLYYRLTGFDSEGKRLFDTPAGSFAHVPEPKVAGDRVTWTLGVKDKPAPAMRLQARLDAPGWENVLLWQASAAGSIDQVLPDLPNDLPVVVESAVSVPTGIVLDSQGVGRWRVQWQNQLLRRTGTAGSEVVGVVPVEAGGVLDYKFVPGEAKFNGIAHSVIMGSNGASRAVTFATASSRDQTLVAMAPPIVTGVSATPYDGNVHVGWDSTGLIAGRDRYEGEVQIAVHRIDADGSVAKVALLPADSTGITDTDVSNGQPVSYELSLVRAGTSSADALIHADAWVDGYGTIPVMVPCAGVQTTAGVVPSPGLDRLYVSIGMPELSYAGTGKPTAILLERLLASFKNAPGITVVDRMALRFFVDIDEGKALVGHMDDVCGTPAQVVLRVVDSTGPGGNVLSLWVTDLSTGRSRLLARAEADQVENKTDLFVAALRNYLDLRLPEDVTVAEVSGEAPRLLVVGPILPVDELGMYYQTKALTASLTEAADKAHRDMAIVTRRFWLDDTRQDPRSIDHRTMTGTVLIVGRAWTGEGATAGVCLQAIDAISGQLIDEFTTEQVTKESTDQFVQWCGQLKLPATQGSTFNSPLMVRESSLDLINPVLREALAKDRNDLSSTMSMSGIGATVEDDRPVLSFGIPLPSALAGVQQISEREEEDPLYALRPYVAPQYPLMFDEWAKMYAKYVEADVESFLAGFEQIARLQYANPQPIKPHLIVRGKHLFTGEDEIPANAGTLRISPAALCIRDFFPMGAAEQTMINYREALSEAYQARPWLMYHAWKEVNPAYAEPFLKAELFGVEDGRYGRLAIPNLPVPFHTYLVADLLAQMNNQEGLRYKQRSLAVASKALDDLIEREGQRLTPQQLIWVTDALLVLVYEQDPGAVQKLADAEFRKLYFDVKPEMQADVLRMLVDKIGPSAWEWADEFKQVDWSSFCWRSPDEMDKATEALTSLIDRDTRESLRAWLDTPELITEIKPDITSASGPANDMDSGAN